LKNIQKKDRFFVVPTPDLDPNLNVDEDEEELHLLALALEVDLTLGEPDVGCPSKLVSIRNNRNWNQN
jgi:hypothetical protein